MTTATTLILTQRMEGARLDECADNLAQWLELHYLSKSYVLLSVQQVGKEFKPVPYTDRLCWKVDYLITLLKPLATTALLREGLVTVNQVRQRIKIPAAPSEELGKSTMDPWVLAAAHTLIACGFEHNEGEQHPDGEGTRHAIWMLQQIGSTKMSIGKANRWLGWAQCLLCEHGYLNLAQCKEINRRAQPEVDDAE